VRSFFFFPRHGERICHLGVAFQLTPSNAVTRALDKIEYTLLPLPKHEPTELILVSPCPVSTTTTGTTVPPLLVQPHGGPHSQAVTEFSYSRAAAVLHGYRFVDVNYPGSTGFGQKTIDDLPPLLGTLEVEATLAAGRYLAEVGLASRERNKNLLMGGSHGGWTACHLTARWPGEYGAVVMRNPVTDLVANASMTDIPDWCYEEAGIAYPLGVGGPPSLVSPEDYRRFYEISPMRHAERVTTPTLLLIGMEDRRVPPNQGRAWYHALKKAKNVDVEMMTFPGNSHPIAETVEYVSFSFSLSSAYSREPD
jgi:acylaminoacyl-peptidase